MASRVVLNTGSAEFLSRGLLWARVLLLGGLMPVEQYGLVLTFLATEGLLAATLAYPSVKDILVRQSVSWAEVRRFSVFFACVAGPLAIVVPLLWKFSILSAAIVAVAAYFNALGQVGLYMLRVADLRAHNRAKMAWAFVTTVLFLGLLPWHWIYLPVVYLAGAAAVLWVVRERVRTRHNTPAFIGDTAYHVRGAAIYGVQALVMSFPQHGVRLFIGATMTLVDVAIYTQTYMLATALFFVYSTVMIVYEPELSRAGPIHEIRMRLVRVLRLSGLFVGLACVHFAAVMVVAEMGWLSWVLADGGALEMALLMALMVYIALNGVQTVVNCLVLAASGRGVSLLSSILGSMGLAIGLIHIMSRPSLLSIGIVVAGAQAVVLVVLIVFLAKTARVFKTVPR